eukprot:XP_001690448.1 predicted protein [Chlamydomonas reinhardtii]
MREGKGRNRRSKRQLGVASYAGRRGRAHYFTVEYEDGVSEMLSLPELRNRITTAKPTKHAAAAASVGELGDLTNVEHARGALCASMPGEHMAEKAERLACAARTGRVRAQPMTASEVEQLCEVIPLDLCGSVFVPWKCSDEVVEVLRSNGCRVRFSMEKEDVRCVEEKSFEKAKSDGVFNGVALLDVSPEMADVALPAASKHSSVCVAAKLPWEYVTQADSARLKWLRSMQREQKLVVIPCGTCVWIVIFASVMARSAFVRTTGGPVTKPSLVVIFESLINSYDGNSDISGRSLELSHTAAYAVANTAICRGRHNRSANKSPSGTRNVHCPIIGRDNGQSPAQQSQGPPAAAAGPTRTASAPVHVNMCTGLVAEVRHLLAACPRRLVPRLGTDGSCGSAAEDIVSGSDVRGLVALLCSAPREGIPAALRLRAAQRLAVLADSPSACGPDDFAHQLCRQGGGSGSSARDAPGPIASGASSSGSWCSPGPLEVALEWMAGEDSCCDGGPVGPEAVAAGARLLTACIDRARRMGWVVALPVPAPPPGFGRVAAAAALAARAPPLAVRLVLGLKGSVFEAWGAAVAAAAADGTRAALGPAALSGCWLDALLLAARIAERPAASAKPWASDEGAAAGQVVDVLLQRTRRLAALLSSKAISSAPAGGQEPDQDQYDEDGLRVVWDSGPAPGLAAARSAWAARPLRERLTWSQTSTELFVNIVLPQGTRRAEVSLTITPTRLTLRLGWCGRVVDGPLHRKVAPSDCIWTLEGHTLQVLLAKAEAGHWWRALFEGGEEKGLYQVLSEAVEADEPLVPVEAMDEGGRLLLEELIERQEMIADGSFDLENSFDDFRLVVGDNTL